jgi:hypothetical protein
MATVWTSRCNPMFLEMSPAPGALLSRAGLFLRCYERTLCVDAWALQTSGGAGGSNGSTRARLALGLWNAKWGGGNIQRHHFSQSADSEIRLGDFEPTVQDCERNFL